MLFVVGMVLQPLAWVFWMVCVGPFAYQVRTLLFIVGAALCIAAPFLTTLSTRRKIVLSVTALAAVYVACLLSGLVVMSLGPFHATSGLQQMAFSAERPVAFAYAKGEVLTINELYGPAGARPGNILPGTYVVKGSYDLQGKGITGPVGVFLSFGDAWFFNTKRSRLVYTLPSGRLVGDFTLVITLTEVPDEDRQNNLKVNLENDQNVVLDRVQLVSSPAHSNN